MSAPRAWPAGVLVTNGACQLDWRESHQELLAQTRNGAYTTALVERSFHVIDWDLHVARLARNLECLQRERPPTFDSTMRWAAHRGIALGDALAALVEPQAALALEALALQRQQQQQQQQEGTDPDQLGPAILVVGLVDPTLEGGHPGMEPTPDPTPPQGRPPSVFVVARPTDVPPPHVPVNVLVAGSARRWAHAKHCQWVLDRRRLEELKGPDTDEVLLLSPEGRLLEGLASNVFVVAAAGEDGGAAGAVLMTNAPAEAALLGVTQQRVLEAAAAAGVEVRLAAPSAAERHLWREAFLTNCVKQIQPVAGMSCPGQAVDAEGTPAQEPWELELSQPYGTVTQRLQDALKRVQQRTDARGWRT